jgi:hypothetical protein
MRRVLVEVIAAVVLAVGGGLLFWGSSFANNFVHDQLVAQQIRFPAKGSPALDPKEFPSLQKYAGQLVDNGAKAKAYAEDYIGKHLKSVNAGKTYSQTSDEARANPNDAKLAAAKTTLFQGETLKGILLFAWGWWLVGKIAFYASLFLFLAAVGLLVAAFLTRPHPAKASVPNGDHERIEQPELVNS